MKSTLFSVALLSQAGIASSFIQVSDPFADSFAKGSVNQINLANSLPKIEGFANIANQGNKKTPEQERTALLQALRIDRTPSGILEARLQHNRNIAAEADKKPKEQVNQPKKPAPKPDKKAADPKKKLSPQEKQKEDQKKLAQYKKDVEALRLNVVLGNWNKVKEKLEQLPDNDAKVAFSRIASQLGTSVNIRPRPELSSLGAPGHNQSQYLRPMEILAFSDTAKKTPDKSALESLARLIDSNNRPPKAFFETLKKGTRFFGHKDQESKYRTAKLLVDAKYFKDAAEFLPSVTDSKETNKHRYLNLTSRFHAEAHRVNLDNDNGKTHLPQAWKLSLEVIGEKKAPLNERGIALYRALALVPELKGDTGQEWLQNTFANASGEGFEILAAVGTLTSQTRNHKQSDFRLEQLKLQSSAASALLNQEGIDLTPWKEMLTLYAINWNAEAQRTQRLDNTTSSRSAQQWDDYGNVYYARQYSNYQGREASPITSGEILKIRPDEKWLAQIDEQVRFDYLVNASQLFLKVKEEDKALPLLKEIAVSRSDKAIELVRNMISVWAENNNPNQQNQRRSQYSYFWGYNQQAATIPLTRSKQERNLKELTALVQKVKGLGLNEKFEKEFTDAFVQCHSKAEVWRLEVLTSVFGSAKEIDPQTASSLLSVMRTNLVKTWPNPKLQQQAKTKRKDKELHAQIAYGYQSAINFCREILQSQDHWSIKTQLAALQFEQSNYKSSQKPQNDHSSNKSAALLELQNATQDYIKTLPLEKTQDESIDAFTNWFYGALGSPELSALKADHQPSPPEFAKIKSALESIPEECRQRHLDQFAKTINTRLANVPSDLKYRYLESALPIIGDHREVEDANSVFEYYQDLVTEIELDSYIDGSDQINVDEPFGLFVNIRHTKEIERESGGFQRYLINQNSTRYSYNYGRPTEDYRDKFEKSSRNILEEHFEIISLTFHHSKVTSHTDPEHGWRYTPYAYFLLKPKGQEVDSIPPLKIDLDFLDTSGNVILPITSAAIPIDASVEESPRPYRDLKLIMTLDEREAKETNELFLEIRSSGHGLIPDLDNLIELSIEGFEITDTEDRELQIEELDATTEDGAPLTTHEWRITLTPKGDNLPQEFTFPKVLAKTEDTEEEKGLTLQKYEDVDLVSVPATMKLDQGTKSSSNWWIYLLGILAIAGGAIYYLSRKNKDHVTEETGPVLPESITPVTLLSFLKKLTEHELLKPEQKDELNKSIEKLQSSSFGPAASPPDSTELQKIASLWKDKLTPQI